MAELEKTKYKDKIQKLVEVAQQFEYKIEKIFETFGKASKGLYTLAEQMAEKEIVKDPINFIRNESVNLRESHNESFFSVLDDQYNEESKNENQAKSRIQDMGDLY